MKLREDPGEIDEAEPMFGDEAEVKEGIVLVKLREDPGETALLVLFCL